jgi:hypothetical protein
MKEGWQKTYPGRSYLRKLKKQAGLDLNLVQIDSLDKEIAVFFLLFVSFPKWISWGGFVRQLQSHVSPATISKVLKTFQDEGIVERVDNPKGLKSDKKYRYTVYRLKLTKYSQRPFVGGSAKSYVMQAFENFPNLLYGWAFRLEVAKRNEPVQVGGRLLQPQELVDTLERALSADKGFQSDLESWSKGIDELYEMRKRLERELA